MKRCWCLRIGRKICSPLPQLSLSLTTSLSMLTGGRVGARRRDFGSGIGFLFQIIPSINNFSSNSYASSNLQTQLFFPPFIITLFDPMEQTPSTPQPTEQQQTPQNPQPSPSTTSAAAVPTASSSLPPPTTTTSFPNPNPTPITPHSQQSTTSQARPPFNTRPWQQPYSHFSLPSPPLPASSASTSSSVSAPPPPRGGMAIGIPAHNPSTPPPPPASFSSLTPPSYSQQSQIRQPTQGMGMTGTLGTTSSMRPSHQMRPSQSSLRPQASSSSPSPAPQNFQGHGMLRVSSLGSPGSPSPSSSQSQQSQTQPWLASGTQGKPPLPTPSLRPQTSLQSFQRSITQQLQHNMPTNSQQQPIGSSQQSPQSSASGLPQEQFSPQFPASRIQQSLSHQQQITRGPGLGSQRPTLGMTQSGGAPSKTATADTDESSNRIVRKRSIQDLVNQIDPSEKLDPEVEDILVDIAEDFVESTVSEIHRERLAAVRKSILATEMMSKNSSGPSGGTAKSHLAKGPADIRIGMLVHVWLEKTRIDKLLARADVRGRNVKKRLR
ncbi:hypothetical protein DH2020_018096 [Rehmannia glutinosa]|uniref:Transcription initiation factor TFIID subunit 12 domain-containing protein n=1 Tax=Rehmannia glutinosa TaxID=99300 RepID=A0ABR0WM48_REHGL